MAKTRAEKEEELVDQVDGWDLDSLVDFAKDNLENFYKKLSNEEIDEEYENCGLSEFDDEETDDDEEYDDEPVQPSEEECPVCKRMKDVGIKCWCCGN